MSLSGRQIADLACLIENFGAENVIALDISEQSDWASYIIIASFTSGRQGLGILAEACGWLHEQYQGEVRIADRSPDNFWFVCDAGEVVIHLLKKDMRDYYSLEELWNKASVIYPNR